MELILSDQTVVINGKNIQRLYGGFGAGQPAILGKQIAEIHGYTVKQINQLVNKNLDWFEDGIDYIDLKLIITKACPGVISNDPSEETGNLYENSEPISNSPSLTHDIATTCSGVISNDPSEFLLKSGLYPSSQAIGGAKYIYMFSQQGYAMLCKLLKSDLAKIIYKQMVREYFRMASIPILFSEQKIALEMAKNFGLQGNQSIFFANRFILERYGIDLLKIGGVTALTSETQELEYNATTLGKDLLAGLSAQKVNKLFEKAGLIRSYRDNKNKLQWDLTEEGKPYGVWKDTAKKHSSGTPVKQLLYKKSIVDVLKKKNLI